MVTYLDSMGGATGTDHHALIDQLAATTTDKPQFRYLERSAPARRLVCNLGTDSWGYEISIEITKPDGTKDNVANLLVFSSNAGVQPAPNLHGPRQLHPRRPPTRVGDGGATIRDARVRSRAAGGGCRQGPDIERKHDRICPPADTLPERCGNDRNLAS